MGDRSAGSRPSGSLHGIGFRFAATPTHDRHQALMAVRCCLPVIAPLDQHGKLAGEEERRGPTAVMPTSGLEHPARTGRTKKGRYETRLRSKRQCPALASASFDPAAFPYAFLTAFGVKETTIARLRKGDTNASDVGGVLQRGNIHIAVAQPGAVNAKLRALRESPKTISAKAKFIITTDGEAVEAEDLVSGEPLACAYSEIADHFGFFLPLAGISTVKELKNNPIDVKANRAAQPPICRAAERER